MERHAVLAEGFAALVPLARIRSVLKDDESWVGREIGEEAVAILHRVTDGLIRPAAANDPDLEEVIEKKLAALWPSS